MALAWSIIKIVFILFGIVAGGIIITKIISRIVESMKDKNNDIS